ncbi:hypothetical protein O181_065037 [Austropuccinia psidii MF-1]|uniref:Uncharacterized protein n=1 Tax=Austropuccinia psidii MF-1 TaxID=1389203 RepID=A0A9Q3ESR9_9BASI|nr:hypothetical protein [Austropuccinia psidii MF-1]
MRRWRDESSMLATLHHRKMCSKFRPWLNCHACTAEQERLHPSTEKLQRIRPSVQNNKFIEMRHIGLYDAIPLSQLARWSSKNRNAFKWNHP